MDAAALGLKGVREQKFVMEDLADPVTVELVKSTQHKVSLKKVVGWIGARRRHESQGDRNEGAGEGAVTVTESPARDAFPRGNWMHSFGTGVQSSVEREAGRFQLALGETGTGGG